jgi:hypothetical protein
MQRLRSALTPWRALLLAALLLAAQAAGLAHRVAHGPAGHPAHEAAEPWGHPAPWAQADAHAHAHAGEVGHGHGDTHAGAECRLYDQLLGHADVLFGLAVAVAPAAPAAGPALDAGTACGYSALAAYQARAPPQA